MQKLATLLLLVAPLALPAQVPSCRDITLSATGRTEVLTNLDGLTTGVQFSYKTTGSPAGVSVWLEGSNDAANYFPRSPQKLSDTTADTQALTAAFRHWYVNVGTLSGGASPTIVATICPSLAGFTTLVSAQATAVDLTATSPASATTVAQTAVAGLGQYRSMLIFATIQGGTGGTLDIYLQVSPDGGTTWVDYAHFPQLAAGAAAINRVWVVSKAGQQTTLTTVGTGTSPALAANTILGGDWGDRMRVVFVSGAGTTAGASQTIKLFLTS